MALVAEQTKRITELEGLCFERYQKIADLQMQATSADSAKAEKQAADSERETLLCRVQEAEAKAGETGNLKATLAQTEELLRKRLKDEVMKDYTIINDAFEREYAAVRLRVSQAEMEVRDAARKAMAEAEIQARERQAVSKRLEEVEAEHKKQLAEVDGSRKPEDRFKKLSSSELQVLKQRLNAAETRSGTAEARMKQAEKELLVARREIEEKESEARTAITEKARVEAALSAARAANQGHMAEASQRLVHLAKLQAEREMGDEHPGSCHGSGVETEPPHESRKGLAPAAVPPPAATQESLQASRSRMMQSCSAQRSLTPPQQCAYQVAQSPAMTKSRASPVAPPTFAAELLSSSVTAHRDRWPRTSTVSVSGVSGISSCQAPVGSRISVHAPAFRAM